MISTSSPAIRTSDPEPLPVRPSDQGAGCQDRGQRYLPTAKKEYNPKSDAPFPTVARLVVGFIHLAILAGIVAMLATYFTSLLSASNKKAIVRIIATDILEVPAPCAGQFRAARHFTEGESVKRGEYLGYIYAPDLEDELRAAQLAKRKLERLRLVYGAHEDNSPVAAPTPPPRDDRLVRLEYVRLENKIKQLQRIRQQLRILSPVSGQVRRGLSGYKPVKATDTLAYIWPEKGELRVQVEAPLNTVHKLLRSGQVKCRFSTAQGDLLVRAEPIMTSLRLNPGEMKDDRLRGELFGFVECVPESIPDEIRIPGLIGRL